MYKIREWVFNMQMSLGTVIKRLFFGLLVLSVLIQLGMAIPIWVADLPVVAESIHEPKLWRSAKFFRSERFAAYIGFVYQIVPANETILIPPDDELDTYKTLGDWVLIRYYLQNYEVIQCEIAYLECVRSNLNNDSYILYVASALKGFDPESVKERLVLVDDQAGLILPENVQPTATPNFEPIGSKQLLWYATRALLWASAYILIGGLWMQMMAPQLRILPKLTLGYGFALATSSFSLFLFMLFGASLGVGLVIGNLLFWFGLVIWLNRKNLGSFKQFFEASEQEKLPLIISVGFLLYLLFALFFAFGKGYYSIDSISLWAARGYGLVVDGLPLGLTQWGSIATAYPLNAILWISQSQVLFSDLLPEGKTNFVLCNFGLFLLCYDFLNARVGKWYALLAVVLFASMPYIFSHTPIAMTNIATSFYIFGTCYLLIAASEEQAQKRSRALSWLALAFIIFAAWTRPEVVNIGLVLVFGIVLFFGKRVFFNKKQRILFIAVYLVYFLFWSLMAKHLYGSITQDENLYAMAVNQWLVGDFHISELFYIIQSYFQALFTVKYWGGFGYLCSLGMIALVIQQKKIPQLAILLMVLGGVYIFMVFGAYYLVSYIDPSNLWWWVLTGLKRLTLPGEIVFWVGLVWGVFSAPRIITKQLEA